MQKEKERDILRAKFFEKVFGKERTIMARFVNKNAASYAEMNSASFSCPSMTFDGIIIIKDVVLAASLFVCLIKLLSEQLIPSKQMQTSIPLAV